MATHFEVTCAGDVVFTGVVKAGGPVVLAAIRGYPDTAAQDEVVRSIESAALSLHYSGDLAAMTAGDGLYLVSRVGRRL